MGRSLVDLLAVLVQPDLRHPRRQPGVMRAHEVGRVHRGVVALEVREGEVEVDLSVGSGLRL